MTQEKENWEVDFRKTFHFLFDHGYAVHEGEEGEQLVSFISELLTTEREIKHQLSIDSFKTGQHQAYAKVREVARELKLKMNVDEYLPKVEAWNKSNYDVPFDDGYEQVKADLLKEIERLAKEGV